MQERYTKQAENVLALAKEAASSCGHSYIGTEHLLVGLVEEKEGTAGRVLEEFGIQADKAMALIDKLIAPPGNTAVSQKPGFSPRTRRVLEGAYAEAESMRFEEVGTEHILLAMLKETECGYQTAVHNWCQYPEALCGSADSYGNGQRCHCGRIPGCKSFKGKKQQCNTNSGSV